MKTTIEKLEAIEKLTGYWPERIAAQLRYALRLRADEMKKKAVSDAVEFLDGFVKENGAVTKNAALEAERILSPLSPLAKSYNVIAVAHAHIDMNWMWGYAETAAVTLDTFRTMLNLMEEYPDFKFSQSQASVYRIVEELDPDMLDEIRRRIKEGRWEVAASTWVEADKNMPNGESMARHILYTKRYLSGLLDISPDSLQLDFEPDTFGHSRNIPEILNGGGVKHYYFCRGSEGPTAFRWKAPSGASLVAFRDPQWYNAYFIDPSFAIETLAFCHEFNTDTMIKVYGVGDHGGGPTRREVEKLKDMSSWPVFPAVRFGTYAEFFHTLEKISDSLPVVDEEMNPIFTGCYSSQSRIKMANRLSEAKLFDAEACCAVANAFASGGYPGASLQDAWRKVLFSQFHDILTGSGVIDTREYAMGMFQQVMAVAATSQAKAMRAIAARIDTSSLPDAEIGPDDDISEGGGAGYSMSSYGLPQTERGRGKTRILHLFNTSQYGRSQPAEVSVWDWTGDLNRLEVVNSDGVRVKRQILLEAGKTEPQTVYWGHSVLRVLFEAEIPALGYGTYVLRECPAEEAPPLEKADIGRVETLTSLVLENSHVRIELDSASAAIRSWIDKNSGKELVDPARPTGIFRLIEEDMPSIKGMSSWIIGRYKRIINLNEECSVSVTPVSSGDGLLRQSIQYEMKFRSSALKVLLSLDQNSSQLVFDAECDWHEHPMPGEFVPQLNFAVCSAASIAEYRYDIPFGIMSRLPHNMDFPANRWAAQVPAADGKGFSLISDTKYGFRGHDDTLSVTLVRSSYEPDVFPESGKQRFRIAVGAAGRGEEAAMMRKTFDFTHAIGFVSGVKREGGLPPDMSFLSLKSGSVEISSVKRPEDSENGDLLVRFYETAGEDTQAVFEFAKEIAEAYLTDVNENRLPGNEIEINGETAVVLARASGVASLAVKFA